VRTQYETRADLSYEQVFVESLQRVGVIAWKLPVAYAVDFFAIADKRPIWIEFKRRSHTYGTYPDVVLSALKWWHATSLAERTGGTFAFAVAFDDGTRVAHWDPEMPWTPTFSHGGRTLNTRDSADMEPVAHIEIERFVSMRT
jgi:hypothetical protein